MRCSSINTLKYLTEVIRFISLSFKNNDGSFKGILPFSRALWKNVYLVLSLFKDNLFALNHLKTLFSSKFAIWKSYFMLLCEKKRSVSSANIMGSNILDTLHKSFTYIMKRSGPKIDPWGTPQIISRLDVFIAPACINCFLFER